LAIRFQSKSAMVGVLVSGGVTGLGFVGLLLAPVWIQAAWVLGVGIILGAIVAIVVALHKNRTAAEVMAGQWKTYADKLKAIAPDARAALDDLSKSDQPAHVRDLITHLLENTHVTESRSTGV